MSNHQNRLTKVVPDYPDFDEIIKDCKAKMKQKFFQYGNSWKDITISDEWWKKRLEGEIKEIFKTKNHWLSEKEIIDAINILAMMWEKHHVFTESESGYRGR